ncbi:MAG TPA: transglutaminase family protein [Candidatus Sulfopaludibacter sp.]|jgi:transglutaminase-like putative cysteine protease|nr:transglutaminase family protein [Candidatus Sulfopaludibacter sp.]
MRISVQHSTVYRYDARVFLEPHTIRLRPRCDASQRLLAYSLRIDPSPVGLTEFLDQEGNSATQAWFAGSVAELRLHTAFEVETLRANPFDYILPATELFSLPLAYDGPLGAALAPFTACDDAPEIRQFAEAISAENGGRTLDFLSGLTRQLFARSTQVVRDEGSPLAPEVTLRTGTGSCRDLAVLFCAVCRCKGIPARFVSGYECGTGFLDRAYMHAWAEVYLEGGGWRGYDPARGLAVTTDHVAVAAAAHPLLAAPVTGTFRGNAKAAMEFQISAQAA